MSKSENKETGFSEYLKDLLQGYNSDEEDTSLSQERGEGGIDWKEQDRLWQDMESGKVSELTMGLVLTEKGGYLQKTKGDGIPTFDDYGFILSKKNEERMVEGKDPYPMYLAEDIDDVIELVKRIRSSGVDNVKIGVTFRPRSHSTNIVIEKCGEEIIFYNTDSVFFDVDDGPEIQEDLVYLARMTLPGSKLYSLGFDRSPETGTDIAWRRQYDEYSCPTFSFLDNRDIMKLNFKDFAEENSAKVSDTVLKGIEIDLNPGNVFNLKSLPVHLMRGVQSVKGKGSEGSYERKGLEQLLKENENLRGAPITILGRETTLGDYLDEIMLTSEQRNNFISQKNQRLDAISKQGGLEEKERLQELYDVAEVAEEDIRKIALQQSTPPKAKKFTDSIQPKPKQIHTPTASYVDSVEQSGKGAVIDPSGF